MHLQQVISRSAPACSTGRGQTLSGRNPGVRFTASRRHVSQSRGTAVVRAAQTITVHFVDDDIMFEAESGDSLLEVSHNAGCPIPTGCGCGSCGTCEVEITTDGSEDSRQVVRACNTMLPRGVSAVSVSFLKDDLWGEPGSIPAAAAADPLAGYPPPPPPAAAAGP